MLPGVLAGVDEWVPKFLNAPLVTGLCLTSLVATIPALWAAHNTPLPMVAALRSFEIEEDYLWFPGEMYAKSFLRIPFMRSMSLYETRDNPPAPNLRNAKKSGKSVFYGIWPPPTLKTLEQGGRGSARRP